MMVFLGVCKNVRRKERERERERRTGKGAEDEEPLRECVSV